MPKKKKKGEKCHLYLDARQLHSLLVAAFFYIIALIIQERWIKIFKADQKKNILWS